MPNLLTPTHSQICANQLAWRPAITSPCTTYKRVRRMTSPSELQPQDQKGNLLGLFTGSLQLMPQNNLNLVRDTLLSLLLTHPGLESKARVKRSLQKLALEDSMRFSNEVALIFDKVQKKRVKTLVFSTVLWRIEVFVLNLDSRVVRLNNFLALLHIWFVLSPYCTVIFTKYWIKKICVKINYDVHKL